MVRGFCFRCRKEIGGLFKPEAWQCPTCVKGDTIILGDNRPIAKLRKSDRYVGLTGLGSVTEMFRSRYSGDIISVKGAGMLPLETTPEHPILVASMNARNIHALHLRVRNLVSRQLAWKHASCLEPKKVSSLNGDYLVIPRVEGSEETEKNDITRYTSARGRWVCSVKGLPTSFPISPESAWLLGLYVAEGYSDKKGVRFSLNKKETDLVGMIIKIAGKMGYKAKSYEHRTSQVVSLSSRILSRAFTDWCGHGASNKMIPHFILFHKKQEILQQFLLGYMAGDGWESVRRTYAVTTSRLLALQLQMMYARIGRFLRIWHEECHGLDEIEGRTVRVRDRYRLSYETGNRQVKRERSMVFPHYILVPIRNIHRAHYNGEVFNIETTDNTYVVSNAVVHNCRNLYCERCARTKVGILFKKRVCPGCRIEMQDVSHSRGLDYSPGRF